MMQPLITPPSKIRVLCVDDSQDLAAMLGGCIAAEPDMESAGSLQAADDLVAEVERARADVVLLDIGMPGTDPLTALRELAMAQAASRHSKGGRAARVIVFSGRTDQGSMNSAAAFGAMGYLSKNAEVPAILAAIREVARGGSVFRTKF